MKDINKKFLKTSQLLKNQIQQIKDRTCIFFTILFVCLNQCTKKETATENLRPKIHFTSVKNWINDPNGLVFQNGLYHLFYQHNPFGNNWGHMSWGHAVSKDLYSWTEKLTALHESGLFFYPKMKFSGSIVIDKTNTSSLCENKDCMIAIFTEWTLLNQTQNIAVSNDFGESFREFQQNPVIDDKSWSFRDPKVFWHDESSKWIMVIARPSKQKIEIYHSQDLKTWEKQSELKEEDQNEGIWECPDLFVMVDEKNPEIKKWVLIFSVADTKKGSLMKYFIGDFDGKIFKKDKSYSNARILDHGFDFYAAISWDNLPITERTIIGWMNNWEYANDLPTYPWKGSMSVPRKLSLKKTNRDFIILQTPAKEIEKLKSNVKLFENFKLEKQFQTSLNDDSFELKIQIEKFPKKKIEIKFSNEEEFVFIHFNPEDQSIEMNRKHLQNSFNKNFDRLYVSKAKLQNSYDSIDLQIIVDKSSIELFALNGEIAMTNLIFPKEKFSNLKISSEDQNAEIKKIFLRYL